MAKKATDEIQIDISAHPERKMVLIEISGLLGIGAIGLEDSPGRAIDIARTLLIAAEAAQTGEIATDGLTPIERELVYERAKLIFAIDEDEPDCPDDGPDAETMARFELLAWRELRAESKIDIPAPADMDAYRKIRHV